MFTLSKLMWSLIDPANLMLLLLVLGAAVAFGGRGARSRRAGRAVVCGTLLFAVLVSLLPLGTWLLRPLENRFPPNAQIPQDAAGLIMLGGATYPALTRARGQVTLSGAAERMTTFAALAREFPELRLVFTGGSGSLRDPELKETDVARRLFSELGLDAERILYESGSKNTYENATMSARHLEATRTTGSWVLVTSAAHMPRAIGVFRRAGFTIHPYPVDYQTAPDGGGYLLGLAKGLNLLSVGVYEWVGLIAYRLLGRTDRLFPGP